MKSYAEMRREARVTIRGPWFWRILAVSIILQWIAQIAAYLLKAHHARRGILTLTDVLVKRMEALQQGVDYALPPREAFGQICLATSFTWLVTALFGSIALYGITSVVLRALKDDARDWMREGFSGFSRPLGVAALFIVQNLVIGFWAMFFVIPGIVVAYRYRLAWYLKCVNPDWGVRQCLGESARMMKGYKMKAFVLDMTYVLMFFPLVFGALFSAFFPIGGTFLSFAGMLLQLVCCGGLVYVMIWFVAGRAVFYREVQVAVIKAGLESEAKNDLPGNN